MDNLFNTTSKLATISFFSLIFTCININFSYAENLPASNQNIVSNTTPIKNISNENEKKLTTKINSFEEINRILPSDIVLGNVNAKIIMIEYFSPTCPHCVFYHQSIFPQIKEKYTDTNKIAYILREFISNKQDLDATILARCKNNLDSYMKFMDVILTHQENWAYSKNYREILTNIGSLGAVTPGEFAACLNDEPRVNIILENTKMVFSIPEFVGTPSFFINGQLFNKPYSFEELSKEIDSLLLSN